MLSRWIRCNLIAIYCLHHGIIAIVLAYSMCWQFNIQLDIIFFSDVSHQLLELKYYYAHRFGKFT